MTQDTDRRKRITEAEAERIADRMVWNRLQRSNRYRNAENAEEQAQAEEEITAAVWADLDRDFTVA